MNTLNSNQKTLKRMIQDTKLQISDEELFLSAAFQKHQTSLAKAATGRSRYALYPYIARKDCLVVDMEHIEDTPIIYNTITRKVYENDQWVDRKLDLQGKFLLFIKPDNGSPQQSEKEMLQNESKPIPSLHIPSEYDTKTQGSHL